MRQRRSHIVLTAYFWLVVAYLLLPVLIIVPLSFGRQEFLRFPPTQFGLRWYVEYFSSAAWLEATFRSLRIALFSSLLSTFLGFLGSIALERGQIPWRGVMAGLFALPAIVPQIVFALAHCAGASNNDSPYTVLAVMNADMVRADHRRHRTTERVTEGATPAVVPGGAAAGQ
jgi:ABC-type spermidine/putrescine transport system permease subunit II